MYGKPVTLHICQITDCHLDYEPAGSLNSVNTDASLECVITAIREYQPPPDFVLATGDLTHDGSATAYQRFRDLVGGIERPVYCLAGNHDNWPLMQSQLNQGIFSCPETISIGGWQIILLNSVSIGETGGHLVQTELTRLREYLSRDNSPTLICLHHHPVPIGSDWMDGMGTQNGDALMATLGSFSQVKAVLWGHVHQAFDDTWQGIRLLGSPSTCFQFTPGCSEFSLDDKGPAYRWLSLHPDGQLDTGINWCEY